MKSLKRNSLGATLCLFLLAPGVSAQSLESEDREVKHVDRSYLSAELRDRPDRDVADTALVFTNFSGQRQKVLCGGFNHHGSLVGLARTVVPANGVRFILASDLADELDFVGSAQCAAAGEVKGTAVFLGPGLTDLPVEPIRERFGRMKFPLIATY